MSFFTSKFGLFEGIIKNMFINNQTTQISTTTSNPSDYENYSYQVIFDSNTNDYWLSYPDEDSNQWLMMEFNDRWISLKQITFDSGYYGRPSKFIIEVYDESHMKWTNIFNYSDSEPNDQTRNWPFLISINQEIVTRKIKITNKGPSRDNGNVYNFRIRAIDIFGVMTKCIGNCTNPINYQTIPKLCDYSYHNCYKNFRIPEISTFLISLINIIICKV